MAIALSNPEGVYYGLHSGASVLRVVVVYTGTHSGLSAIVHPLQSECYSTCSPE